MNPEEIKGALIEKHGFVDDIDALTEYILLVTMKRVIKNEYTELHHILTRSFFPEFLNESWNLVRLTYNDHIKAHELLFKSFNLRVYQRPLNYMKSDSWMFKDKEAVSRASKRGWQTLKNDNEKFNNFKEKRSQHMKSLSFEEQSRRASICWERYTDDEYNKRCEVAKSMWTEELRNQKGESMKKFLDDHPGEMSRRVTKRWKEISDNDKENFDKTMQEVNSRIEKREAAGASIKNKWKDPSFKDKMMQRVSRSGGYICVSPSNEKFEFMYMPDVLQKFNFNYTLIRINMNSGKPVEMPKKQADRIQNVNTVGWFFYTKSFINKNNIIL
jgi:hypothetical protein